MFIEWGAAAETENLYFAFEVPQNAETYYTITYKNLSVNGWTGFYIESVVGEVLYDGDYWMDASRGYALNRKLEAGRYILRVYNREGKTGNIKVNVAARKDKVGNDQPNAAGIKAGATVTGSLDGYCDKDYYKFVAPSKGIYEFYGKNLSIDTDCRFAVYSSSEEEMGNKDWLSKNNQGSCALKCEKGDVYYLSMGYHWEADNPAVGNYKIYVKKVGPGKVKTLKVRKTNSYTAKLTWSKAFGKTGYEIQISKSKKFKTYDHYLVSGASDTHNFWSKGTYYIRVRAYKEIDNQKYYGSFSPVKKFVVK